MRGILSRNASGCLPQGLGKIKYLVFAFDTLAVKHDDDRWQCDPDNDNHKVPVRKGFPIDLKIMMVSFDLTTY